MDYDNEIERLSAMDDLFRASLGLCQIAKNQTVATQLKKLRRVLRQVADAEAKVIAAEEHAAEIVAKAESEVAAIHDEAQRRLDAAVAHEQELATREHRITALEASWRMLGEPADVMSGFRSPEFSPLQKARMAYGQSAGKDVDVLGLSREPEPTAAIDALINRDVGDARTDHLGNAFAASTLTRSTEHKRGTA
jgi:hypothetical protein